MYPPIFVAAKADAAVTTLLGNAPLRLYPFGEAPQGVSLPYAVWQVVNGSPENFLSGRPDIASYRLQVDVYAATGAAARSVADALEHAIELQAHVVSYNGEDRDKETRNYRSSFDVNWFVNR